jgi:hypothetical protein
MPAQNREKTESSANDMSDPNLPRSGERTSVRGHSSYDDPTATMSHIAAGVPIQCHFCPGQSFRRSRLRMDDLKQLFLMRYPVRCLRCSQRQMVSFTLAGISVPSHVKQRRARREQQQKHWTQPVKESLRPRSTRPASSTETAESTPADGVLSRQSGDQT